MREILVFGGGRMGISHASMAGLLDPEHTVVIIEPNLKTRLVLKCITGRKFRIRSKLTKKLAQRATHAIIATPPGIHEQNVKALVDFCFTGRLLVEKPISVDSTFLDKFDYLASGYVLKKSYFWTRLIQDLGNEKIVSAKITLETNQDFASGGDNWRLSKQTPGLNLINEFGSHCTNLMVTLLGALDLKIAEASHNSVILQTQSQPIGLIHLKAASSAVRKSIYTVEVETEERVFETDFYTYSVFAKNGSPVMTTSVAREGVNTSAYLRGYEFSRQMEEFLSAPEGSQEEMHFALVTDQVLKSIEEALSCQN